jgi:hypothetical protein
VEDRISGLKDKIDIREKTEEFLDKRHKNLKEISKKSVTPSEDQTYESQALKKRKRCKPRNMQYIQKNNSRKSPKS